MENKYFTIKLIPLTAKIYLISTIRSNSRFGQLDDFSEAILCGSFIFYCFPTFYAFVDNIEISSPLFNTNGLHHSKTRGFPVAWIYINVLTPKALRAMVGVPAAFYLVSTMVTREIFNFPCKVHRL